MTPTRPLLSTLLYQLGPSFTVPSMSKPSSAPPPLRLWYQPGESASPSQLADLQPSVRPQGVSVPVDEISESTPAPSQLPAEDPAGVPVLKFVFQPGTPHPVQSPVEANAPPPRPANQVVPVGEHPPPQPSRPQTGSPKAYLADADEDADGVKEFCCFQGVIAGALFGPFALLFLACPQYTGATKSMQGPYIQGVVGGIVIVISFIVVTVKIT